MFKAIINLFFPETCAACDTLLLQHELLICTGCRHEMPFTNFHLHRENEAFRKFYGRIPVLNVTCFIYFQKSGLAQQLIHKLKYKNCEEIGQVMGNWFAPDLINVHSHDKIDEVIPVPLHPKRLKKRGYNQIALFGKTIAVQLGATYNDNLLVRKRYSKTQTAKNLLGRTELKTDLFGITTVPENESKHYLLVDDVLTTGATVEACCRALLKIPGARISVACIAFAN